PILLLLGLGRLSGSIFLRRLPGGCLTLRAHTSPVLLLLLGPRRFSRRIFLLRPPGRGCGTGPALLRPLLSLAPLGACGRLSPLGLGAPRLFVSARTLSYGLTALALLSSHLSPARAFSSAAFSQALASTHGLRPFTPRTRCARRHLACRVTS